MRRISSLLVNETSGWVGAAVAGMLFDERHEDLVRERAWLPQLRVGPNDNILLRYSPVKFDLVGACRRPFCVVTKQRASDAQERVFHVELFAAVGGPAP